MKDRYLIKSTYLDGPHAGHCYLLRKEGFVTDIKQYQWDDTTYSSFGFADRVCKKMTADNDWGFQNERNNDTYNQKRGRPAKKENEFIYWHESFVPIRVDPETGRVDLKELTTEEIDYMKSCLF